MNKSVALAEEFGIDQSMPRHAGHHRHMPYAPAATPSQNWKTNMYLPFMGHLLQKLDSWLLQGHARFNVQYLIPTKVIELTDDLVQEIFTKFQSDLEVDYVSFARECRRWKAKW
ncbi:uncharacterized protein LOC127879390 [Dreissena polymorpha]|uniref:Uncharacterized protein n=1 Tax=Dreissena polymorpha TaxID=45954 RepID=A0A9D4QIX1_DREPO|nr:uncharacterized protein LOC127879390 [Dreissena polymorpha]KAH3833221.1 hypothetical protein DPMN_106524 [Dreissena polymorpha]